jgi:Meckel syndrome type 1 protein
MNQITPPPSDDDLPDERELAALYARLPKIEPDASLDAAVLAEATRATPTSRRPRWPVALASAAVLVLAVGVAWQVRELQPVPSAMRTAAAPPAAMPASATPPAADRRAADSIAAEAAPTPELRRSVAAPPASDAGATSNVEAASNVGAASAAKPAQRVQVHRAPVPAIAAQIPAAPAPELASAPAPEPAAAPPVPAAPPSPPSPSQEAVMSAAPAPSPQRYKAAPAPSGMLRENMAAKVAADTAVPSALGPDDRVGEIRRLLGSGDRAQALRELKELRRRYPHYDLPQDLRDLNP